MRRSNRVGQALRTAATSARRDRTIANLQRQARRFELALVPAEAA